MTEPTPRIPKLPAAEETAEAREVLGVFASHPDNHVVRTFAQHPALAKLFLVYNRHLLRTTTLDPRLRQIAIMRVTWISHSVYMWSSHLRMSLNIGMTGADFEAAKLGVDSPHWSPLERLIVRAADEYHEYSVLSDATWHELATQLERRQIMDLLFTIGTYGLVAFVISTIRIDREPELQALALQYGAPTAPVAERIPPAH
jgi:alkylhydroperoxidase family enzyme